MCLDWNGIVRRATVLYDGDCGFCKRSVALVRRLDWFGRLDFRPIGVGETGGAAASGQPDAPADSAMLEREMGLVDENGEVYYGADAFEALGARCPLLWPLALALKVPGAILVARPAYRSIARHRRHLVPGATCGIDGP
jgi:predicted DCC family thiol-disulfide oxidoreductase YuxK